MVINNYSDLSNFVFSEYAKMQDFGVSKPPDYVLKVMDRACIKYMRMYSRPLFRKQKAKLRLQAAIESMPHGALWRFLHPKLWAQVQDAMKQPSPPDAERTAGGTVQRTVYPEICKPIDVPQLSHVEPALPSRVND